MMANTYQHWKLDIDADTLAWLCMDRKDTRVNVLNEEVLDELNSLLHEIASEANLSGLIIYAETTKGFCAGADIKTFADLKDPTKAADFLRKGQAVFSRLEALSIPTAAALTKFCLGGGLELALACDYRVATEDTRIGLPEIMLGIHPGWGGTVRLPELIGGFDALSQVILPGSPLPAIKAKKLGIIDDVVPLRQLKRAATYFVKHKPTKHKPSLIQSLSNSSPARAMLAPLLRYNVAKRIRKSHYPAPYAVIDLWEKEFGTGERAYFKEVDSIENLLTQNDTAANLIRIFHLRERLKNFAKESDFKAHHVHVIGAGVMGGDIAAWCALRGLTVTLQDISYEKIAPAMGRANALFKKKLRQPRLVQATGDRLNADPQGDGIAKADVIIEAVFENEQVKKDILKEIESKANSEAIIATNTSSIPLEKLAQVMVNPERLVGIHFFNPVAKMQLVEIVSSPQTLTEIRQRSCAFASQIDRLPLPVKSTPGFLINRVLMPYLLESVCLLEEGYPAEVIDKAATDFGMMMGPIELADTVGMDVCLAVAENLTSYFGGSIPQKLRDMVAQGKLGRKSGQGFYRYQKGKPIKQKVKGNNDSEAIANRLIQCMIDEATACLEEKVVTDSDLIDAGMVFGTGFAPFRGGPMNYAKQSDANRFSSSHSKSK